MSTNTVTIVLPSTNVDGSALALAQIASFAVTKTVGSGTAAAPVVVNGPFTAAAQVYTDSSPDFGQTDNYSVTVTETDGQTGAAGTGSVAVPSAEVPSAPSVSVTFNP